MAMELEEIIKIIIAVFVLVILIGGAIFLFSEKGGELLNSLRNIMKFGR